MLPGGLVSIYQQYKQDTNAVASWLASTARACGFPADRLSAGSWDAAAAPRPGSGSKRRKGKARKEARANPTKTSAATPGPKYIVAVADFIPLARFIAASPKPVVSVPDTFVTTLDRVIAVRAGFGTNMSEHGAEPDIKADRKHNYFVGILEELRDVLRPKLLANASSTSIVPPHDDAESLGATRKVER